jgi:hypothetical protein
MLAVLLVAVTSCGGSERATSRATPTDHPAGAIDPRFGLLPTSLPDGMRVDVATAQPTAYVAGTGFSALYADDAWVTTGRGRAAAVLMETDYTSLPSTSMWHRPRRSANFRR